MEALQRLAKQKQQCLPYNDSMTIDVIKFDDLLIAHLDRLAVMRKQVHNEVSCDINSQ